jgi:glucokinase
MKHAIGIDLGGTYIKYAVVQDDGTIIFEDKCFTLPERNALIGQLKKTIRHCLRTAGERGIAIDGIGVGTPGIVDPTERILLGGSPNIEGWEQVPLADEIEEEFGLPTRLCNDANAMAMAEHSFGVARGLSDVIFISIGTGIGGAVIVDNKMLRGYMNRGGELGCTPLNVDGGIRCNCGAEGCWESYASTAAMLRFYERVTGESITGEQLVARYLAGERAATEIWEKECYYIGRGIAGFINIFAPQMVVIGGGISEAGDFFIRMVSEVAMKNALRDCSEHTAIRGALMGNQAGVIGAAGLIFDR